MGLPANITACLFDLDGVLTDTASLHAAAWAEVFDEVLRRHGDARPFDSVAEYQAYVDGKRREDGVRDFLASRGITLAEGPPDNPDTVQGVARRKNDRLLERMRTDGVTVFEGSRRYLEAARAAGLHRVVVSSSANTGEVLLVTGLDALIEGRVDGVTAGQQELQGKPAPDMFLAGARLLGLEPSSCAVFEDAVAGVEAGRSGGFGHVVGVDRVNHAAALRAHGADVVVRDLAELL